MEIENFFPTLLPLKPNGIELELGLIPVPLVVTIVLAMYRINTYTQKQLQKLDAK